MRNKLLVTMALLTLGIATASCEKTPNEEPASKQSSSNEIQPAQQQPSSQTASPPAKQEAQSKGGQQEQRPQVAQQGNVNTQANAPSQSSAESQSGAPASGQTRPNQPNQPGQNQQAAGRAAGGPLNLNRDQFRQAQMLLKEKGFDVGDVDGVLGPRTRRALIAFQRQQGLEPSGQIDQRTASALGLSNVPG
jgi:outer membrane biosynthesis protein TonB